MRTVTLILLIVIAVATSSCRQKDIRTIEINIPEMENQACQGIIADAVAAVPGVLPEETGGDVAARTLTVTYDSMVCARKNIEFAVANAGFRTLEIIQTENGVKTNEIPANVSTMVGTPAP